MADSKQSAKAVKDESANDSVPVPDMKIKNRVIYEY